jgi:predicted RNA-binding protein with PUA-like domain
MARQKNTASRYWLFKSEPDCYSIDDLQRDKRTFWDGVRNYQARNTLRDEIRVGDGVLFYHSSTDPMAVVGTMEVVRAGYPDHTAFDPQADHFDPKSKRENPAWFMVDVAFKEKFATPVTREMIKGHKSLANMVLMQQGSRLSIQPVTAAEWGTIRKLAGI